MTQGSRFSAPVDSVMLDLDELRDAGRGGLLSRVSISTRLYGLVGLFLMSFSVIAAVLLLSRSVVRGGMETMDNASSVAIAHRDADMMHDALRADALAAIVAETSADLDAVKGDIGEHSKRFSSLIREMVDGEQDVALKEEFASLEPSLTAYAAAANRIVEAAGTDTAAARGHLPEFYRAFKELEGQME